MPAFPSASEDLNWKISRTCDGGACIGVARSGDSVVFGSTQQPAGPVLIYTAAEWQHFLAGAKQGDFDTI